MRSAKAAKGPGDDVDELLSTAKRKQSELQLKKQAAAAPPPGASPPPPSGSAAPATSGRPLPPRLAAPGKAPAPAASGGNIVRELPK